MTTTTYMNIEKVVLTQIQHKHAEGSWLLLQLTIDGKEHDISLFGKNKDKPLEIEEG